MILFYVSPLVVPPAYTWLTRGKHRRYVREMWIGFFIQLFWTAMVWYAARYYRLSGNEDWRFAWFYLIPVNVVGYVYFATMSFWTLIYKKRENGLAPTTVRKPTPATPGERWR